LLYRVYIVLPILVK